jgi:hypothetical protein
MKLGPARDGVWLRAAADAFAAFLTNAAVQAEALAKNEPLTAAAVRNAQRAADAFVTAIEARDEPESESDRLARERDARIRRARLVRQGDDVVWVFADYVDGRVLLRPEGVEYDVRKTETRDAGCVVSVHRRGDGQRVEEPLLVLAAAADGQGDYVDLADPRPTAAVARAQHDVAAAMIAATAAARLAADVTQMRAANERAELDSEAAPAQ